MTGACTRAVRAPLGVSGSWSNAGSMEFICAMATWSWPSVMTFPSTTAAVSARLTVHPALTSAAPTASAAMERRTERVTSCPFEVGPRYAREAATAAA